MKHVKSQGMVDNLKVGDTVSTPGITGVVLAKGNINPADNTSYAGVQLLTTVQGNSYHPFRSALFWYDDDTDSWHSGAGQSYTNIYEAVHDFEFWTGGLA